MSMTDRYDIRALLVDIEMAAEEPLHEPDRSPWSLGYISATELMFATGGDGQTVREFIKGMHESVNDFLA